MPGGEDAAVVGAGGVARDARSRRRPHRHHHLRSIGGAIKATDEELAANPRARSAVLRVAQKREASA